MAVKKSTSKKENRLTGKKTTVKRESVSLKKSITKTSPPKISVPTKKTLPQKDKVKKAPPTLQEEVAESLTRLDLSVTGWQTHWQEVYTLACKHLHVSGAMLFAPLMESPEKFRLLAVASHEESRTLAEHKETSIAPLTLEEMGRFNATTGLTFISDEQTEIIDLKNSRLTRKKNPGIKLLIVPLLHQGLTYPTAVFVFMREHESENFNAKEDVEKSESIISIAAPSLQARAYALSISALNLNRKSQQSSKEESATKFLNFKKRSEEDIASLQKSIREKDEKINELDKKLKESTEDHAHLLKEKNTEIASQLKKYEDEIKSLEDSYKHKLKSVETEWQTNYSSLQNETKQNSTENQNLLNDLKDKLAKALLQYENLKKESEHELLCGMEREEKLQQEHQELEQTYKQTGDELESVQSKLNHLKEESAIRIKELGDKLEQSESGWSQKYEELQKDHHHYKEESEKLSGENRHLNQEAQSSNQKFAKLSEEFENLKRTFDSLTHDKAKQEEELYLTTNNLEELKKSLYQTESNLNETEKTLLANIHLLEENLKNREEESSRTTQENKNTIRSLEEHLKNKSDRVETLELELLEKEELWSREKTELEQNLLQKQNESKKYFDERNREYELEKFNLIQSHKESLSALQNDTETHKRNIENLNRETIEKLTSEYDAQLHQLKEELHSKTERFKKETHDLHKQHDEEKKNLTLSHKNTLHQLASEHENKYKEMQKEQARQAEQFNNSLAAYQREIDEHKKTNRGLQDSILDKENENRALQSIRTELEYLQEGAKREIDSLKEKMSIQTKFLAEKGERNRELEEELSSFKNETEKLKEEKHSLHNEIDKLNKNIEEKDSFLNGKITETENLRNLLNETSTLFNRTEEQLNSAEAKLKTLAAQRETEKEQMLEKDRELQRTLEQFQNTSSRLDEQIKLKADADDRISHLMCDMESMEKGSLLLKENINELTSKLDETNAKLNASDHLSIELKGEISHLRDEEIRLTHLVSDLEKVREELAQSLNRTSNELKESSDQSTRLNHKIETLQRNLKESEMETGNLIDTLSEVRKSENIAREEGEVLSKTIEALANLETLQEKIGFLKTKTKIPVRRISLLKIDDQTDTLRYIYGEEEDSLTDLAGASLPLNESIFGEAIATGRAIFIKPEKNEPEPDLPVSWLYAVHPDLYPKDQNENDNAANKRVYKKADRKETNSDNTKNNYIILPLKESGNVAGLITIALEESTSLEDSSLRFLEGLAPVISLTLERQVSGEKLKNHYSDLTHQIYIQQLIQKRFIQYAVRTKDAVKKIPEETLQSNEKAHLHLLLDTPIPPLADEKHLSENLLRWIHTLQSRAVEKLNCKFIVELEREMLEQLEEDGAKLRFLFWFFYEAVENSIRHSMAKEIIVRSTKSNSGIDIVYSDNGEGLIRTAGSEEPPHGEGLKAMLHLAGAAGGTLSKSRDEHGYGLQLKIHFDNPSSLLSWNGI